VNRRITELRRRYETVGIDVRARFGGLALNRVDIRRRSHLELSERLIQDTSLRVLENWIGDVKPLYIVADYAYRNYHSVYEKYGDGTRRKKPSNHPLGNRGSGLTWTYGGFYRVYERIKGFAEEVAARA
jgi:hypothetical protein